MMAGLVFLFVFGVLGYAFYSLGYALSGFATETVWLRRIAGLVLIPLVVGLSLIDEIIGQRQFEALCKANGIDSVDLSKARGRKVKLVGGDRVLMKGTAIPIREEADIIYFDPDTKETLIRHKDYFASGGWLAQNTPLTMGSSNPVLFYGNGCGFDLRRELFAKAAILIVN